MNAEIKIDNLKCGGCANAITTALRKFEGVDEVAVDVDTSTVHIRHGSAVSMDDLLSTLANLGYPKRGSSTTLQKAKSYVSCAIGRFNKSV